MRTEQMDFVTATSIPCSSAAFAELSTDLLRSGRSVRFRARGVSMSPLVRDGDVVLVQPVDAGQIRVGDLVFFSPGPGRVVVHRVIRRRAGPAGVRFTVQGDQLSRPDGVVTGAQVHGRVAAIERAGAHVDLDRPALRLLGWLAVLRSRWNVGRSRPFGLARRLFKKLPVLSRYLVQ